MKKADEYYNAKCPRGYTGDMTVQYGNQNNIFSDTVSAPFVKLTIYTPSCKRPGFTCSEAEDISETNTMHPDVSYNLMV